MAWAWHASIPAPIGARLPRPIEHVVGGTPNPYTFKRNPLRRGHQWHVYLRWNALRYSDAVLIAGHLSTNRGGEFPMEVPLFAYRVKRGTKAGTVTLDGAHAAGVDVLDITGGTGTFAIGDWFHMLHNGHPYAYVCVAGESGGLIQVNPPLRVAASGGAQLIILTGSNYILDTMDLPPDFEMPEVEVSPNPRYTQPFHVEFETSLP